MINGLSSDQIKMIFLIFKKNLSPAQGLSLYIFGSRAMGTHKKFSDVDILIEVDSNSKKVTNQQLGNIRECLEESRIPFKFDIVRSEDVVPAYKDIIESQKIFLTKLEND